MNLVKSLILLLSIFLIGIPIGCTQTDKTQTNQTNKAKTSPKSEIVSNQDKKLESQEMVWQEILPGEGAYGLKFTQNGTLSYQGVVLLPEIPVSQNNDNSILSAKKLVISPPSLSGNYHFMQACENRDNELCWAEFLIDKVEKKVTKIALRKYGVLHWVQWSKDEENALVYYTSENYSSLYGLNLKTGEFRSQFDWFCQINLDSFSWIDNKVFRIQVLQDRDRDGQCDTDWFKGSVSW